MTNFTQVATFPNKAVAREIPIQRTQRYLVVRSWPSSHEGVTASGDRETGRAPQVKRRKPHESTLLHVDIQSDSSIEVTVASAASPSGAAVPHRQNATHLDH